MITPVFQLSQCDRFLTISIRAPYCKLREAELSYDERTFLFHARPYFLRLFLPAEVVDDETGTCDYDSDQGMFTVRVPKKNSGEHFARLDMLSELLRPQQQMAAPSARRMVEELASTSANDESSDTQVDEEEVYGDGIEQGDEFYAQQEVRKEDGVENALNGLNSAEEQIHCEQFGYGFGWTRSGVLGRFRDEIGPELFDLASDTDLEESRIDERVQALHAFDVKHFNAEHYLADLFSPEQEQLDALQFCAFADCAKLFELNEQDLTDLKDLRVRLLPKLAEEMHQQIAHSLVDVLFGFLYDFRTTQGEHNVESSWTVSKLAPSLTFLVRWPFLREALRSILRHSLVVPLYRNWELSLRVLRDVERVVKMGRPAILHSLLATRRIFNRGGEFRYLFNQLLIDDLCLWIQSIPSDELLLKLHAGLSEEIAKLSKADVGEEFELDVLETEARLAMLLPLDSDDDEEADNND